MMEATKHYVKYKTRSRLPVGRFLLNSSINYITPFDLNGALEASMPQITQPIYEVIVTHGGTCFKIVRLDVYPPRTIAKFKPKLYVKAKTGFRAFEAQQQFTGE